jgi:hypothetical protein
VHGGTLTHLKVELQVTAQLGIAGVEQLQPFDVDWATELGGHFAGPTSTKDMLLETQVTFGGFCALQTRLSVVARSAGIEPHTKQMFAPLSEEEPAGHLGQVRAPFAEEKDPAVHREHAAAPAVEEKDPREQAEQTAAPPAAKVPGEHSVQLDAPAGEKVPAGHRKQEMFPPGARVPA